MGGFKGPYQPPGTVAMPAQQRPSFPDLIRYEVLGAEGWVEVKGHSAQVQDGCLLIHRGVFIDADCTQPSAVPSAFYAQGEWRQCKTDYDGYSVPSEFAIDLN
jgi:hypothetical protein